MGQRRNRLGWLMRQVRQLVYPRRCPYCQRVLGSVPVCQECAAELETIRRKPGMRLDPEEHYFGDLSGAAAPYRYEGIVRDAVLHAKFQGAPWTADELGVEMARLLFGSEIRMRGAEPVPQPVAGLRIGYDCVVPVPASSRKRGYNVPERMARAVAQAVDVPLVPNALYRVSKKRHQVGLSLQERLINVAGAFRVTDPELVEGKQVLLVDDIITTGATVTACTQALLAAGAQSVFAVALAAAENDAGTDNARKNKNIRPEDKKEFEKNRKKC